MCELRPVVWEISVYEDRNPDAYGEEHHCPPGVLLLPKCRIETVGTPEGSDGVACEVDVDRRAHEGDKDDGVETSETPLEEGGCAGD